MRRASGTDGARGGYPHAIANAPGWADFFVAIAGASAGLTGLLFIAVSLRPREIRGSRLMIGRARSAFYAFATIDLVALLALAAVDARLVGAAQLVVGAGTECLSVPFSMRARRERQLNYLRASLYHGGVLLVIVAGAMRFVSGDVGQSTDVLAAGVLMLLGIALSNSWQLVISHQGDVDDGGDGDGIRGADER